MNIVNADLFEDHPETYYNVLTTHPGTPSFRWLSDMPHSNRMSNNLCSNYGVYLYRDFPAHNMSWREIYVDPQTGPGGGSWGQGLCLALRGRSLHLNQLNKDGKLDY